MSIYLIYVTFATSNTAKFVGERRSETEARQLAGSYDDAKSVYILVNGTRRIQVKGTK